MALAHPVTYVSEALRAVTTDAPHVGTAYVATGLTCSIAAFGSLGLVGFRRRAIG